MLAAFAVLLGLGVWQLERMAWKEDLIATLAQRLSAPPVAAAAARGVAEASTQASDEFRRVSAARAVRSRPRGARL